MLRAKNEWHFYCFIAHGANIPRISTSLAHGTASKAERRTMPTVEVAVCIWLQLWRIPASCFCARSLVVGPILVLASAVRPNLLSDGLDAPS